ncbi:MAG: GNAT family protein [Pseudomonadota bacterium]
MSVRFPVTDRVPGEVALQGQHVRLEPLAWPAPGDALCKHMAGEADELWAYMLWGPFATPKDVEDALRVRQRDAKVMVLSDPAGRVTGTASFLRIREAHGSAELGSIAYGAPMQRSPAGTEAILLMMKHLFDDLGYRRCEWKCNAENARSVRAAERLGFTFEGIHRQDMVAKGENRDTAWFSILDTEWPDRCRALEAWLDPANFDAAGQQRQALRHFVGGPYRIPPL